jgi:glycosyltransferase involved in cell wall biosynthesis
MSELGGHTRLAARVGLVATETFDDPTGIGTYTRQLVDRLPRRVDGFCCVRDVDDSVGGSARSIAIPAYLRGRYMRRVAAPMFLATRKLHLLHFPTEASMYLVRFGTARVVVTVHGLASILLPAELHEKLPLRARFKYKQLLETADRIITVSESSKRDIISVYDVAPERITVVYNGIDEAFAPTAGDVSGGVPRGRPYIISVGATIPKKNISAVVRMLAALKERGLPHKLVHIGPPGSAQTALEADVRPVNLRGHVEFT